MNARGKSLRQGLARLCGRGKGLLLRSGTLLVALALVAVVGTIWRMRAIALDEARRETTSLAFLLAEQTTRSLQAIDIVLQNLSEQIERMGEIPEADLDGLLATGEMNQLLRARAAQVPQAQAIALIGASGRLLNTSRAWPTPEVDLGDRAYFAALREQERRGSLISEPVRNRATGAWTLYLARRMNHPDGRFAGVIVGGIDIDHLHSLFDSVHLPRQLTFLLLRRDGTVLVSYPEGRAQPGESVPPQSPWFGVVARGGGDFVSPGRDGEEPQMVSARPLREYPLVLDISVTEDAVLDPWRRDALFLGSVSVLIIAYAVFLLRMNGRQLRRAQQSEASLMHRNEELNRLSDRLRASEAHLSQKSQQLQTTLATMDQGLMMIDQRGHVVVCNDRAMELLHVPHEMMAACPAFTDVLEYQWRANRTGGAHESFEDFVKARTIFDRPTAHELRRPNGRVIEVRSVPLGNGGAVRTYTDITERKACEDRSLYFAHHDDLTRLVNRLAFKERLERAIMLAGNDRRGLALFYLDLDRFKLVNDQRGHRAGDALLVEAAQRMQATVRSVDTVARIGGDEFTIILPYLEEHDSAGRLSERLIESLNRPFVIDNAPVTVGVSIGIAFFPQHAHATEALMLRADEALYAAKSAGRNTYRFAAEPAPHDPPLQDAALALSIAP